MESKFGIQLVEITGKRVNLSHDNSKPEDFGLNLGRDDCMQSRVDQIYIVQGLQWARIIVEQQLNSKFHMGNP